MTEITRKPPSLSASLSLVAATATVLAVAVVDASAVALAVPGVLVLGAGAFTGSRRLVTFGGAGLGGAVLAAGLTGAPPEPLLVGGLGAVLAFDVAEHGIGVGEQLGRESDTRRVQLVHAAASLLVGVVAAGLGYGAFLAAAGNQPVTALVFLLLGVFALVGALRR